MYYTNPQSDNIINGFDYNDVIMGAIASQITCLTIVYSTFYSEADHKKASKLRVTGLCGEFTSDL